MTSRPYRVMNNQRGSVINVALLILILIFLVGIGLHKISTTDIKISSNLKTEAAAFYEAEAGLEAMSELVELNVRCPGGFDNTNDFTPAFLSAVPDAANWETIEGTFIVTNLTFWANETAGDITLEPDPAINTDIVAYYTDSPEQNDPLNVDEPHTSFSVGGPTRFARGSAIQMAAGYEGLGKGAAAGGANIVYDIYAMRYGEKASQAHHMIQWVHILGLGGIGNKYCL